VGLFVVAAAAGCSSAPTGPPPFSSLRPYAVVQTAVQAANRAGSMHFLDVTTSGKHQVTLIGKISAGAAEEVVQGTESFEVLLHDATIYVRGSSAFLTSALSLSSAEATAYAGKWISVSSGDNPYEAIAGTLTLEAELNSYLPTSPLKFGRTIKLHGHRVASVLGTAPASVTGSGGSNALFVSATGPHYPLGGSLVVTTKNAGYRENAVFSNWGEAVTTSAPSGAVPLSSISGAA